MKKKTIRTTAIAGVALASALVLSACSTGTTPEAAAPLDRTDSSTIEQTYVAVYEDEFGPIDTETEGLLVDLGYSVCESFDSGLSFWDIGQIGINSGMAAEETGFIVGSAVAAFCPEYKQDVIDAAEAAGVDTSAATTY